MQVTYTNEPLKTAASVLEDKAASIELWAKGLATQTLDKEPTFLAYCELGNYGAANDYDGKRSTAQRLYWEITTEVQIPACILYRSLQEAK